MLALALLLPFHEVRRLLENGELTWESPQKEVGETSERYKLISNILHNYELRNIITKALIIKNINLNGNELLLISINIKNNTKNTMKIQARWEFTVHETTRRSRKQENLTFKLDLNDKLRELLDYYANSVNNILILLLLSKNAKINYVVSNDFIGDASLSMLPYITGAILVYPKTVSGNAVRLARQAIDELLGVNENNVYYIGV